MRIAAPLSSDPLPILQWIETASSFQIPGFHIVGLPSPEVGEARERIRAAIESSGFEFPRRRIVLNLAPASVRKRGTGLDLGMSLGVLASSLPAQLGEGSPQSIVAWGELGLDGTIKSAGQLTRVIYSAWKNGVQWLLLPREDAEAAAKTLRWFKRSNPEIPLPCLVPVSCLKDAWAAITSDKPIFKPHSPDFEPADQVPLHEVTDDASIGELLPLSFSLERILAVAAGGRHHCLLLGPRGTGKSHALEWLIALQPPAEPQEKLENALLSEAEHEITETLDASTSIRRVGLHVRPSALVGHVNSSGVRPGEFSLAHGGMLIADELPEWNRDARESLREPLETGSVILNRAQGSVELPARFTLAANGNLCPCGGWPRDVPIPLETGIRQSSTPRCRCGQAERSRYIGRLSGPVLDRMDAVVMVFGASRPRQARENMRVRASALRERVTEVHARSKVLWGNPPGRLPSHAIEEILLENPAWRTRLDQLIFPSLRSRHKTLRLALTLALWDGKIEPGPGHFAEASCYRPERFGLFD